MSHQSTILSASPVYYFTFNQSNFNSIGSASPTIVNLGDATFVSPTLNTANQGPDKSVYVNSVGTAGEGFYTDDTTPIFDDNNFSISCWIRTTTNFRTNPVRTIFNAKHGTSEVILFVTDYGAVQLQITDDNNNVRAVDGGSISFSNVDDGRWHHVLAVVENKSMRIFVDGVNRFAATSYPGDLVLDSQARRNFLRYQPNQSTWRWQGDIAHFALFSYAIPTPPDPSDIEEIYMSGLETWPYRVVVDTLRPQIHYDGGVTSNAHPVPNFGSAADGTTSGTYIATSGTNAMNQRGFQFDRSAANGFSKTPQDVSIFGVNNTWKYVSAWVNVPSFSGRGYIFESPGTSTTAVWMRINGTGVSDTGRVIARWGSVNVNSTIADMLNSGWRHVLMFVGGNSGNTVRIFIDGVARGTNNISVQNYTDSARNLRIGRSELDPSNERFVGLLDEFTIAHGIGAWETGQSEIVRWAPRLSRVGQYQLADISEDITINPGVTVAASASMLTATASAFSNSNILSDVFSASANFINPTLNVVSNISTSASAWLANAEFLSASWVAEQNISQTFDVVTASAEMLTASVFSIQNVLEQAGTFDASAEGGQVIVFTEENVDVIHQPFIADAELVEPTVLAVQNINLSAGTFIVLDASMGQDITIEIDSVILSDIFSASALMLDPNVTAAGGVLQFAAPMLATARMPILHLVNGQFTWPQANKYQQAIVDIGAEIYVAKTIVTDNTWTDYKLAASATGNFVFGINNRDDAMGTALIPRVPQTAAILTCNDTKWGGIFSGSASDFMNFYPSFDNYGTQLAPTAAQLNANEDYRYIEFTGPWFYGTTEDSYELIFRTTEPNQILLSGQTTYTVEGENTTPTFKDDTRVNTYVEYGLTDGKLYVKYYPSLKEEPIVITGEKNIADGKDHHIVLQRTSEDGFYRDKYRLSVQIGNINPWSTITAGQIIRHSVVGEQSIEDKFYSDPFTGEIFHGFEMWVDGELDTRSASFNSSYIAPIAKTLGGKSFIFITQGGAGQIIRNRATTSGIKGVLTSIVGRFNTEKINALSSYNVDIQDMPRFPQEAKIIKHAAIDPPTIKKLANLALFEANIIEPEAMTAEAEFIEPSVQTNVKKILRLYWTADETVGTNFGTNSDGIKFIVDTYSVLHQLSNNPSHVYNVDAAARDRAENPEELANPNILERWKDEGGVDRLININTDIDLDEYSTIIFMDYPDNSDEIDSILPDNNFVYIQDQMNQFINRLKEAVVNGKSLYVSSPTLAVRLGIISGETIVNQQYKENDLISQATNPFTVTSGTKYFDTHRNNRYEIVKQFTGVTDIPGYSMTEVISYEKGLNDEYHIKYENRSRGLMIGDQMLIPGLPIIPSQLNKDYAGYTNNRITRLHVVKLDDVVCGQPIAKLADTNLITTLALKPGDLLGSSRINGRIFVNFVEDALTMGIEEYNYGYIQAGVSPGLPNENKETVKWDYSTSRTTRKLTFQNNIIDVTGIFGQTTPTNGGGGPIVQAPTSSTFGNIRVQHDSDNERFASSIYFDESSERYKIERIFVPSMTLRGIRWLTNFSYTDLTHVGADVMTANADSPQSGTYIEFSNSVNTTSMYAGFDLMPPAQDGKGAIQMRPLPQFANAEFINIPTTIRPEPMTANSTMLEDLNAVWIKGNSINLNVNKAENITFYIKREVN
jgi:hypothetical protein